MSNFSITITGADDGVDPIELDQLGEQYPFVEFGILFSESREGQARYPTRNWRKRFYDVTWDRSSAGYHTAAHLCGKTASLRAITAESFETEIESNFDTVQFNNFTIANVADILKYASIYSETHQVIVPFNKGTETILTANGNQFWQNVSILCDSSGGKGIACKAWPDNIPKHFELRQAVGYAGGVNESNIEAVIDGLCQYHGSNFFWVDLETGARDDKDRFDIEKVARLLESAEQFIDFDGLFGDSGDDDDEDEPVEIQNIPELIVIR